MKCINCGAELRDGCIYCVACGHEARIVPDYNFLDDELAANLSDEEKMKRQKQRMAAQKEKAAAVSKKKMHIILLLVILIGSAAIVGMVFAIITTVVKPPLFAASAPVKISSLCVCPGSRKCTCTSTSPGATTISVASIVFSAAFSGMTG